MHKICTYLLISLAALAVSAAETYPEKVNAGIDPVTFKQNQAATFAYLMANALPVDSAAMVFVQPNPTALDQLIQDKTRLRKQIQRVKIGTVNPIGAGVDFTNVTPDALRAKISHHSGGVMTINADGDFIWTIGVTSPQASALRMHFIDVNLPSGVSMYIHNTDGEAYGPYTYRGPNGNGDFWANTIAGSIAFVQIRHDGAIDQDTLQSIEFVLEDVGHLGENYLVPFFDGAAKPTHNKICSFNADCVEDASCYGSGAWSAISDAKNATAHIQFVSGAFLYICSGGLLNDTDDSSQVPYFLTANHCISKGNEAASMEAFWQFATNSCGGSCYNPNGAVPRTLGASILSSNRTSDYTLMQLDQNPPAGSVLLGWTSDPVANTSNETLYRIHHPGGAPQAYTEHEVDTATGTCKSWPRGDWIYSNDVVGATEGGSSGSLVCNAVGQVVGQLSGACGFNVNDVCDAASNATVDGALAAYYTNVAEWLDPDGGSDPPTGGYTLTANGYKVKGVHNIDLTWSGTSAGSVDVYRDGALIATVANSGSYPDNTGQKGSGSYTYQVCDAGTGTCSNTATVNF